MPGTTHKLKDAELDTPTGYAPRRTVREQSRARWGTGRPIMADRDDWPRI